MSRSNTLTNNFGAPLPNNERSQTAGERGPVVLQDYLLLEKLAHFDRERIPERVVHAKGAGAFGYFHAAADMSEHTRAHLFGAAGLRGARESRARRALAKRLRALPKTAIG